jgi:hypothetical protein
MRGSAQQVHAWRSRVAVDTEGRAPHLRASLCWMAYPVMKPSGTYANITTRAQSRPPGRAGMSSGSRPAEALHSWQ